MKQSLTKCYRIVDDEHGKRVLRDNYPVTLEELVREIDTLQHEHTEAVGELSRIRLELRRLLAEGGLL